MVSISTEVFIISVVLKKFILLKVVQYAGCSLPLTFFKEFWIIEMLLVF